MKPLAGENVFPHYDEKYICRRGCCGEIHAKRGAERIGMLMPILLLFPLYKVFGGGWSGEINIGWLAFLLVELICTILFFIGTRERKSFFVIPFILLWGLLFLYAVAAVLFLIYAVVFPNSIFVTNIRDNYAEHDRLQDLEDKDWAYRLIYGISALIFIGCAVVILWFLNVIYRSYRYLKEFEEHRNRFGTVAVELGGHPSTSK